VSGGKFSGQQVSRATAFMVRGTTAVIKFGLAGGVAQEIRPHSMLGQHKKSTGEVQVVGSLLAPQKDPDETDDLRPLRSRYLIEIKKGAR
jgi:hypothetical protein